MPTLHRSHRILLVDEELDLLLAAGNYFSWLGFEVDMASSLEEAQALLRCRTYGAVVADVRLAGSDARPGLQMTRMARAISSSTRIVLLSAGPIPERDVRRQGADVVLPKPKPLPEVADCLISLLQGTV